MEGRPYEELHEFCDFSLAEQNEAVASKGVPPSAPSLGASARQAPARHPARPAARPPPPPKLFLSKITNRVRAAPFYKTGTQNRICLLTDKEATHY